MKLLIISIIIFKHSNLSLSSLLKVESSGEGVLLVHVCPLMIAWLYSLICAKMLSIFSECSEVQRSNSIFWTDFSRFESWSEEEGSRASWIESLRLVSEEFLFYLLTNLKSFTNYSKKSFWFINRCMDFNNYLNMLTETWKMNRVVSSSVKYLSWAVTNSTWRTTTESPTHKFLNRTMKCSLSSTK